MKKSTRARRGQRRKIMSRTTLAAIFGVHRHTIAAQTSSYELTDPLSFVKVIIRLEKKYRRFEKK